MKYNKKTLFFCFSSTQHGHVQHAGHHLPGERRLEGPVPGHVDQLSARDPDGGGLVQHVRADEANAQPGHGHEGLGQLFFLQRGGV